jgi:hypothetical protein
MGSPHHLSCKEAKHDFDASFDEATILFDRNKLGEPSSNVAQPTGGLKQLQHQGALCYNEKVSRLWHNTLSP